MSQHPFITSRRIFLAASGTAAAALATVPRVASAAKQSEVEAANEKVVNDFCAAWKSKDAEEIGSYLHEECSFRMIEEPVAERQEGKDEIMGGLKRFLANAKSAEFEVLRSVCMGNTVLNDRVDRFEIGDNKQAFHISGFFLVKDGKIREWQDYTWPKVDDEAK